MAEFFGMVQIAAVLAIVNIAAQKITAGTLAGKSETVGDILNHPVLGWCWVDLTQNDPNAC